MYFRADQADIRLTVTDPETLTVPTLLVPLSAHSWKTVSGGELTADNAKTRPGGMGLEVDIGGPASRGDITLETQLTDVVVGWWASLEFWAGIGLGSVSVTLLNPKKTASAYKFGPFTGTIKTVTPPDMGGSSDAAMLQVVMSCNELVTAGN